MARIVFSAGAASLLLLTGAFWASGLSQGAPYVYHPDEPAVMARALRIAHTGVLNPGWFHYPSLCIYLDAVVASIVHTATRLPLAPGVDLLFEGARASVVPYYVAGRALTLAFALGTTLLTALMARRLAGAWPSLLAGVAFATSALVYHSAVFTTVDMPLTFFTTLATLLNMRAIDPEEPSPRWWYFAAIVAAGSLGAGAKYNGALVLPVFAAVFLVRRGARWRSMAELAAYALLSVDLFIATTPYSVLDVLHFWSDETGLPAEFTHYRTGHLGADSGSSVTKGLSTLQHAVGPLVLFSVISAALLLAQRLDKRRAAESWVLLATFGLLAAPVAFAKVFFQRNCLPLVPIVIAFATLGVRCLFDFAASRARARRAVTWTLTGVLGLIQARTSYGAVKPELDARAFEDTRSSAQDWAVKNLPRGSRILREAFTPHLHLVEEFVVQSVFCIGQLQSSEDLDGYDYVVTSSAMWQLFPDLGATLYGRVFSRPPIFESTSPRIPGYGDFPTIRIHRTGHIDPPDLDSRVIFRLSEDEGFADLLPLQQLSLELPQPGFTGALSVVETGDDACLLLPEVPRVGPQRYLLRLNIESPADTWIQLFYATSTEPTFDEKKSVRRRLGAGENHIDLRFGPVELANRLRLDPGERSGSYLVHSIALFTLPAVTSEERSGHD